MTTVPATEFNRNPSRVKRLASEAPVVVTEHHRPTLVVLSYAEYERLTGAPTNLASWLEMDDDIEFDIEPVGLVIEPVADL